MHLTVLGEAAEHGGSLDIVARCGGRIRGEDGPAPRGRRGQSFRIREIPDYMFAQILGAAQKIVVQVDRCARNVDDRGIRAVEVELDLANAVQICCRNVEHRHTVRAGLGGERASVATNRQRAVRTQRAEGVAQIAHRCGNQAFFLTQVLREGGVVGRQALT